MLFPKEHGTDRMNTDQLNIDQFTKFVSTILYEMYCANEMVIERCISTWITRQELPANLAADLQRVREETAAL